MKQKYVVLLDKEARNLAIQEYAELDKEMLSLLCEESYDVEAIQLAMEKDRNALIQALRTNNMYPPGVYTERIADAIIEMFQPEGNTSAELFFEERELFENSEEEIVGDADQDSEDTALEVDDLLDDDISDDFEEKGGLLKDLEKKNNLSDDDESMDDA